MVDIVGRMHAELLHKRERAVALGDGNLVREIDAYIRWRFGSLDEPETVVPAADGMETAVPSAPRRRGRPPKLRPPQVQPGDDRLGAPRVVAPPAHGLTPPADHHQD